MNKILITGTSGFIGFHLAKLLLSHGLKVHGYDGLTDYYDVSLKIARQNILLENSNFTNTNGMLESVDDLKSVADTFKPDIIIHLAAQAGVRYSLKSPRSYINSNIIGTFNVIEVAKELKIKHLLMASTSSVYGGNTNIPFTESEKADTQLTLYAATKKANESMAHSYSHLWKIPTTMFRFFTVYGPWGRPDMALFKFVSAILNGKPIDIYNNGNMYRDFTFVDDLVHAIKLLMEKPPERLTNYSEQEGQSLVAPFRIVNIGNSSKINLLDFIEAVESILGKKAIRNYMPMQIGDVNSTLADTSFLKKITDYSPQTNFKDGISKFVHWYKEYYDV